MAGEKTEKATPKRKQEERKKGNIFQSKDVVVIFSLVLTFYAVNLMFPFITSTIGAAVGDYLKMLSTVETIEVGNLFNLYSGGVVTFIMTVSPIMAVGIVGAVLFTILQTKFIFSTKSMAFKFNRLNPLSGIKKMFSMRGIIELVKSILKITVLGYIIYINLSGKIFMLPRLMDLTIEESVSYFGDMIMSIVNAVAGVFIFLAIVDYGYQWWEYEKSLRMSKQDIKEEYKQMEGDPQIKGKIRELQQKRAMSRMMQAVPTADVVIRNPTHFAVAVKYTPKQNTAPVVVAKGADNVAMKIVEIAEQNGVTVTENKPLARGLFESVNIDMEIPEHFFQPVAEVLAFVYSLKKRDRKK